MGIRRGRCWPIRCLGKVMRHNIPRQIMLNTLLLYKVVYSDKEFFTDYCNYYTLHPVSHLPKNNKHKMQTLTFRELKTSTQKTSLTDKYGKLYIKCLFQCFVLVVVFRSHFFHGHITFSSQDLEGKKEEKLKIEIQTRTLNG